MFDSVEFFREHHLKIMIMIQITMINGVGCFMCITQSSKPKILINNEVHTKLWFVASSPITITELANM
ncbi:hypothetical protein BLOT_004519 [Blomia tropicalis]|nr:hypothetical protein BLOT_004519 [Blomia tropicalis]